MIGPLLAEFAVVLIVAALAAASIQTAFGYLLERQWDAFVFLTLAAVASVVYGGLFMQAVRGLFVA